MFQACDKAGFEITKLCCDNAFKPMLEPLQDNFDSDMNFVSKDKHVPEVEHHNCTIKEHVCSMHHHLPCKNVPKQMMMKGVEDLVLKIDWVPPKGRIS